MPLKLLLGAKSTRAAETLTNMHEDMVRWFAHYEQRLQNDNQVCTFSYRGRTSALNPQSGLDDYPRGDRVNGSGEIHLDLQSWMVEFAKIMEFYSAKVGNQSEAQIFRKKADCYAAKMHEYLYNENTGFYADYLGL